MLVLQQRMVMKFRFSKIIFTLLLVAFISGHQMSAQKLSIPDDVPKSALKAFKTGQEAMKAREFDKALKSFDKAISKYPEFNSAKILKASIWYKLKNFEGAETLFQEVIDSGSEVPKKVYLTLGIIQNKLNLFDQSVKNLQTFLDFQPKNKDLVKKANKFLRSSTFAVEAVKNPVAFDPLQMPATINTNNNEYMPDSYTHLTLPTSDLV